MFCALIDKSSNCVINIIIADPNLDPVPYGYIIIAIPNNLPVQIGWTYDLNTNKFIESK